jgi:hypothetical protein
VAGSRELKVVILGDATSAQRALGSLDDSTTKTEGRFSKMGAVMKVAMVGAGIAAVKFGKDSVDAFNESVKVGAQTEAVIKSTGGAANVTAKQVGDLASELQGLSGVEDEAIQSGQNMLLTFTNLKNEAGEGNDVFNQATRTLLDMSVALGTDAKTSAVQLGKALNDPIAGISALSRVGVTFTDEQKATIRTMVEMGDTAGAQKVILAELNKEFGGSAKAAGDAQSPMEKLSLRFGDLQEKAGGYLIPALEKLTEVGLGVIDFVQNLDPGVLALIGTVAAFAAGVLAINQAIAAWAAVQAALNAVMALNPFVLVAIAVAALVAGVVIAYRESETFRNIVQGAFDGVGKAATTMRDVAVTAVQFLVDKFLAATEWIIKAAASAFGWVPGIGPKLREAAREVEGFRNEVNAALAGIKDKEVTVRFVTVNAGPTILGAQPVRPVGTRAHGGPVMGGSPYLVGERGPELIVPAGSGTVIPNHRLEPAGGGTPTIVFSPNVVVQGNVIAERDLADEMIRQFQEWVRRNGSMGL